MWAGFCPGTCCGVSRFPRSHRRAGPAAAQSRAPNPAGSDWERHMAWAGVSEQHTKAPWEKGLKVFTAASHRSNLKKYFACRANWFFNLKTQQRSVSLPAFTYKCLEKQGGIFLLRCHPEDSHRIHFLSAAPRGMSRSNSAFQLISIDYNWTAFTSVFSPIHSQLHTNITHFLP